MATIKKGDFVEIEYTGKLKETGDVFDTTDENIARAHDIYNEKTEFGAAIVCIGESHLIDGLDKEIEGKETEKEYTIDISPEQAFGKKNPQLLRMIPASVFKKEDIQPVVGLQVAVDGMMGIVKTANSGRIIVDFNHPLAGKEIVYEIKVNKIIEDAKEQVKALLKLSLGKVDVKIEEDKATIALKKDIPKEIQEELIKKITTLTKIKKVEFSIKKEAEKDNATIEK